MDEKILNLRVILVADEGGLVAFVVFQILSAFQFDLREQLIALGNLLEIITQLSSLFRF